MDRVQAGAEYRRIPAGVVRHYRSLDRQVSGAAAPLTNTVLAGLRDKLWAQREPGALSDAEVITLYRLRLPLGLVARHRNALDAV